MVWILVIYVFMWIAAIFFIPVRLTLLHPILTFKYAVKDLRDYIKYKKWNIYKTGKFVCYDANCSSVFGSGKTLSAVYEARRAYKKYNNKKVFDVYRRKWVTQKIHILTNLSLNSLPYEKLVNLGQIVTSCENHVKDDIANKTLTALIVVIDEAQNQLHCRSFKDNLSPLMLQTLTQCRHYNTSIFYTCPRFNQVDALLRQCTAEDIKNHKVWRWQCQSVFDASDVENASNVNLLKPYKHSGFFVEDDLFVEYDTKEIIDNLIKAKDRNDFLTDEEILNLQCNTENDVEAIKRKSKRAKKKTRV